MRFLALSISFNSLESAVVSRSNCCVPPAASPNRSYSDRRRSESPGTPLVGKASEKRGQKGGILLLQLFRHIVRCGIVVGYNRHGFPAADNIGNDIQDRLCLSRTRRPLNDTDFGGKRPLYRQF